jgi:hypothetical protein
MKRPASGATAAQRKAAFGRALSGLRFSAHSISGADPDGNDGGEEEGDAPENTPMGLSDGTQWAQVRATQGGATLGGAELQLEKNIARCTWADGVETTADWLNTLHWDAKLETAEKTLDWIQNQGGGEYKLDGSTKPEAAEARRNIAHAKFALAHCADVCSCDFSTNTVDPAHVDEGHRNDDPCKRCHVKCHKETGATREIMMTYSLDLDLAYNTVTQNGTKPVNQQRLMAILALIGESPFAHRAALEAQDLKGDGVAQFKSSGEFTRWYEQHSTQLVSRAGVGRASPHSQPNKYKHKLPTVPGYLQNPDGHTGRRVCKVCVVCWVTYNRTWHERWIDAERLSVQEEREEQAREDFDLSQTRSTHGTFVSGLPEGEGGGFGPGPINGGYSARGGGLKPEELAELLRDVVWINMSHTEASAATQQIEVACFPEGELGQAVVAGGGDGGDDRTYHDNGLEILTAGKDDVDDDEPPLTLGLVLTRKSWRCAEGPNEVSIISRPTLDGRALEHAHSFAKKLVNYTRDVWPWVAAFGEAAVDIRVASKGADKMDTDQADRMNERIRIILGLLKYAERVARRAMKRIRGAMCLEIERGYNSVRRRGRMNADFEPVRKRGGEKEREREGKREYGVLYCELCTAVCMQYM